MEQTGIANKWKYFEQTENSSEVPVTFGVVIHGEFAGGLRFRLPLRVTASGGNVEEAIIEHFGSQSTSFEELAVEQGWTEASWTYPQGTLEDAI